MVAQTTQMNGKDQHIVTGIKEVPVTLDRPPAVHLEKHVKNPGVARVNCCPTVDTPDGTILNIHIHRLHFVQINFPRPVTCIVTACGSVRSSSNVSNLRTFDDRLFPSASKVVTTHPTEQFCSSTVTFGTRTRMASYILWTHTGACNSLQHLSGRTAYDCSTTN